MSFKDLVKKTDLRVLTFDIENAPNTVYTWGLYDQSVGISQIKEPGRVFGFGGKWYDESKPFFYGEGSLTHEEVILKSHAVLNEAYILVSYNGKSFDMKHMNKEFLGLGLPPVKPSKHIDLLQVVRRKFNLPSRKLDYVAQFLGLGSKTKHTGFELWKDCMAGDSKAWALMERYCKQDVKLTEDVYNAIRPWIPNHPHLGVWLGSEWVCTNCGTEIDPAKPHEAKAVANVTSYNLYQCVCGHWLRGTVNRNESKIRTRSAN